MPASTPDPTRWLAELMATQQTFMQSLGAAVPPFMVPRLNQATWKASEVVPVGGTRA